MPSAPRHSERRLRNALSLATALAGIAAVSVCLAEPSQTSVDRLVAAKPTVSTAATADGSVWLSQVQAAGHNGGDDRMTEQFTLNFRRFEVVYTTQDNKGAAQPSNPVKWDLQKNAEV